MKTVVVCSGGLDSVTLAHWCAEQGDLPALFSADYGQRHVREIGYARACAARLGVRHEVADLRGITRLISASALTGDIPVPDGHYDAASLRQTVVPNRNLILLAVAAGWAETLGYDCVAIGAHDGDHAIYPDCRPEFIEVASAAIRRATEQRVLVEAPFLDMDLTKAGIVLLGHRIGVPFAQTWSCYKGEDLHCGRCSTCIERREAFACNGISDPTDYAAHGA